MPKLGVVENFLKYKNDTQFGVIGCGKSNVSYLPNKDGELGNFCMIGFSEDVIIWNMKSKEIVHTIHGRDQDNVTFIAHFKDSFDEITLSIGYESGFVSVYNLWTFDKVMSIKCHRHPITSIIYCNSGRIVCGSQDTDISVVDIQGEEGYRMKGHVSPITKLQYISHRDMLISSSQDGSIKFWFLCNKHCFKTITNKGAVWDFNFVESTNLMITVGDDLWLNTFKLTFTDKPTDDIDFDQCVSDQMSNVIHDTLLGTVTRDSKKRALHMAFDANKSYLALNTGEKKIEIFKLLTEEELSKRLKKKAKKATKTNVTPEDVTLTASDRVKKYAEILFPHYCKAITMIMNEKNNSLEILGSMKNNTVAVLSLDLATKELTVKSHVSKPGHRTAVIYSQFTSDGMQLFTLSLSEAKLWNKSGFQCIYTLDWPRRRLKPGDDDQDEVQAELDVAPGQKLEANTAVLLPGDRHVAIGFRVGVIIVYSLVNGDITQWMNAHEECITSLIMTPDKKQLFSSSTDKALKVWQIEYGVMKGGIGKLQIVDSGISERFDNGISKMHLTPDNKTVLIGFLNNKVQSRSLTNLSKRILDFYKHSQPITCIDVKYDSKEILTGSGDKTVVKWNLQFADFLIFKGHRDEITDVKYIPGRSMAFSADKSGLIIQINLKNMTEIIRLKGHNTKISSLALFSNRIGGMTAEEEEEDSGDGEMVSVSTDCSMRLWYESDEILSREVEEEEQRDKKYEEEELVREEMIVVGAPQLMDTGLLTKKTLSTEQAVDEVIEALDNYRAMCADPTATADPKMIACGVKAADLYVLHVLNKVRGGDLEFVLVQLPMLYVEELFVVGAESLQRNRDVCLLTRCLSFLVTVHFKTIKDNRRLVGLFAPIAKYSEIALTNSERSLGFIVEALDYLGKAMGPEYVEFEEKRTKLKSKKTKKK